MNNFPNRPPRKMNGFAALLARARDLAPSSAQRTPIQEAVDRAVAADMARRLQIAERQVGYIRAVLDNFEKQAEALPHGHPFRDTVEAMIKAQRDLLAAAEREVR